VRPLGNPEPAEQTLLDHIVAGGQEHAVELGGRLLDLAYFA
jgi:hypothetical protein